MAEAVTFSPPKPARAFAKVAAILNTASGSVDARSADRMKAIAAEHGVELEPRAVLPHDIEGALRAAVAEKPDLLIVLAGDGTLALGAELCGPDGPLIAALPGGTMNMLPHALNGRRSWPDALKAILDGGEVLEVSGGEVSGKSFYVAAILGAPALWADAREAVRHGKLRLAALRARRAVLRAFKGRLRFTLEGRPRRKAEALTFMCPLVSRGLQDDVGLEAATLDPRGALDGFRLGLSTLIGRWRDDPAVEVSICRTAQAWASGRIPAVLDGEPHRLTSPVEIRYRPRAFRALVPADCEALSMRRNLADRAGAEAAGGAAVDQLGAGLG
jgi:diacylglycerol kinase family enzyme